ncbi:O-antigen polysaccharide polymerase Wzy [Devosia enhydra]|nr:O-antigen polysaccharide polymerase Wzy [Devosia enhydra]
MNVRDEAKTRLEEKTRHRSFRPGISTSARHAAVVLFLIGVVCFFGAVLAVSNLRLVSLFGFSSAALLFISAVVARRHPFFLLFCLTFCLFHFGLLPLYGLHLSSPNAGFLFWYQTDAGRYAILASGMFLIGLHLSVIFEASPVLTAPDAARTDDADVLVYRIALAALCLGCAIWAVYMLANGVSNYREYVAHFSGSVWGNRVIRAAYSLIAAAAFLCALYGRRPLAAGLVFALWGAAVFILGPRNEVVLPGLIVVAILVARGLLRLPWWGWSAAVVVVLTASSAAALVRWDATELSRLAAASPLAGLGELGWSLRPVVVVLEWIEAGDPLRWGQTYVAPFDRYIGSVLPGWNRVPAAEDMRLMNVLVADRVGTIGFSIVAEAIINFGIWALMPLGFLVGSVVTLAGRLVVSRRAIILALPVLVLLFVHIRQSWATSVAMSMFVFFALLALMIPIAVARYVWPWLMTIWGKNARA